MAGWADADAADLWRALGAERREGAASVDVVTLARRELHDRRRQLRVAGKRPDHELPVARDAHEPRAGRALQRTLVGVEVTDDGRRTLHGTRIQAVIARAPQAAIFIVASRRLYTGGVLSGRR